MKALIIAAGAGNRLRQNGEDHPKPLFKLVGLTLIDRVILSVKKAGIRDFVVVVGFEGDRIRKHLQRRAAKMGVNIQCVDNPDWEKGNGHSVLKARPFIQQDDFLLLMSDHIFDWKIIPDLTQTNPKPGEIILATDRRVAEIYDIEDATKVKTSADTILGIGKHLKDYNEIDTGIFYCSGKGDGLFSALERSCAEGKGGLSEAIQTLSAQKRARTYSIGNRFWQDVDTPEGLVRAEREFFRSVRKETDGFVSQHFNRHISGWISRLLAKTPLTPNQVTWSALMVGLLSGFLVSRGTYWDVALGGILFQFASIYDGCDGEVAKLKLASTKFGEWLDTISDNITYVAFLTGVVVGLNRQGYAHVWPVSVMAGIGVVFTLILMFFYLARFTNSGSMVTVQKDLAQDMEAHRQSLLVRFIVKAKFVMKRDFFAFFFMGLCLLNRLDWILIAAAIGSNVGWLVLIALKREFQAAKSPSLQQQ